MTSLSSKEILRIVKIGQLSQECLCEEQFAGIITQEMLKVFDSRSAVFLEFEHDESGPNLGESVSFGLDDRHSQRYRQHYHKLDPCYSRFATLVERNRFPGVSTDQVIESESSYINSEYYVDFLMPTRVHESLIFGLGEPSRLTGLIGLHRSKGQHPYTESDHTKARLVAPYLSTAILYRQQRRLTLRQRAFKELVLQSSNVQAYAVLDQEFVCVDAGGDMRGILHRNDAPDCIGKHAREFMSKTLAGIALNAFNRDHEVSSSDFDNLADANQVRVTVIRDHGESEHVLLTFLRPDLHMTSEGRMQFFGLTPRQREVVHLVELGFTNQQIASSLGISCKTVINHLTQIYEKTQTHNKTSLVRQLFV